MPVSEWLEGKKPIPLWLILLVAAAVHGPLLMMRVPENSFDANFHMSMANHYAHHWFNPWNEQQLGGFSQTTYPPLTQQWIGLLSWLVGLSNAYMLVQLTAVLLLPLGVYFYAKLWVSERAASYAAMGSIFLGSSGMLIYLAGQIGTTSATPLYMLSFPFIYRWMREGLWPDAAKGMIILLTAASAHHATLLFGSVLFVVPLFWLACIDRKTETVSHVVMRTVGFFTAAVALVGVVLLPYFLSLLQNPIKQMPIFHQSRSNFLLDLHWGVHYWVVPFGFLILALPYIFWRGTRERRLLPLFVGFYVAMIFGLGSTTPLPKLVLGRAFDILTYERFTYWACIMALPFVGLLAVQLLDRFKRKALVLMAACVIASGGLGIAWNLYYTVIAAPIKVEPILAFLERDGHDQFRYLTLGFGNQLSKIAAQSKARSIDGEYNSARSLPEIVEYGSAQLSAAKYFGVEGMAALTAVLRHADRYGLKYVFVRDQFYEPLLHFAGFRKIDVFNQGEVTVWSKPFVPVAKPIPSESRPPAWHGWLWGTLPFGTSLLAIAIALKSGGSRRREQVEGGAWNPSPGLGLAGQPLADTRTTLSTELQQKICLITAFPPGRGDLNEYGYHLAREMSAMPHVALTILADQNAAAQRGELSGFNIRRCWAFNSLSNPLFILREVALLRPDVAWFNMGFSTFAKRPVAAFANLFTPLLLRLGGVNTHITLHTFMDNVNLKHAGVRYAWIYRFAGHIATRVLLAGGEVTVLLPSYKHLLVKRYGADPSRVHVRPHGVLSGTPVPPDPTRRQTPTVLAFGNWGTYKRLESLLEAMKDVVATVPDARLVVGGADHPNAPGYLESIRSKYGTLPFVTFLGYVPESSIEEVFSVANVVVMPYSSGAGASGVAHQACEFGVPVIAADLPDFREMSAAYGMEIDFFSPGDGAQMARKIVALLRSPERQHEIALRNHSAAQRLSLTHVVRDYLASFETAKATGLATQLATP